MKTYLLKKVILCLFFVALGACSSKESLVLEDMHNSTPAEAAPEQVNGRMDVYNSMARAVKYNINTTIFNMKNKIDAVNPKFTAKHLLQSISPTIFENKTDLSEALRVLDFSIIFASYSIENSSAFRDEYLFEKSAQHLSLVSIRSHLDALFGLKNIKSIDRTSKQETKQIDALNQKAERTGKLTEAEIEYKKGIDVALHNQNQMRSAMMGDLSQYLRLIQGDEKKLELEGRRFYELEDFDDKYTLAVFQRTAAENRSEILRAKRNGFNNDYEAMLHNVMRNYPEIEHLQINGADINDEVYVSGLVKRALLISENLIDSTLNYLTSPTEIQKKSKLNNVYKNLGDAIFAQVEIAYNLVEQDSEKLSLIKEDIAKQIKTIRAAEKNLRGSYTNKVNLLNLKNNLLKTQIEENKLIAERAVALRSLYFYAGFSPFSKVLLEQKIRVIADNLKIAFNKDMVSMLSLSPDKEKVEWEVKDEDWAKGENWLEQLVDERKQLGHNALDGHISENTKAMTTKVVADTKTIPTAAVDYNKRKVLQLGAYLKKESADMEWKMLKQIYPELRNQKPKVERTNINGQVWYRLIVESANGGWLELCEKLKKDKFGCILR